MRVLVLSGGGMFGAYQAAAWTVLSPRFSPDLVLGVSIGAVNGWLVSSGADPVDLANLWLHTDDLPQFRFRPRWCHGPSLLASQNLLTTLQRVAARPLRIPLAMVATRCRDLEPVVFRSPGVDWRHLAASCSIPLLLPPSEIDRRLYWDGGIWTPLPLWAAYNLGATEILAIHCLPQAGWPIGPLMNGLRRLRPLRGAPPGTRVRVVAPQTPLDNPVRALSADPARIRRWMARGVEDARRLVELDPS